MRVSRLAIALAAVACAVALPAAAAAHKSKPANHGHHGKGDNGTVVRLAPVTGQKAKGAAVLTQHTGAVSFALVVARLTPGLFYAAHLHSGACGTTSSALVTLPDLYADEDGVAKLVVTAPTAALLSAGGSVDVHAGPSGGDATVIACGDIKVKTQKAAANARLKGANHERGRAELIQKGNDVSAWIKVSGLTPGLHAVAIHAGTCALPQDGVVALGDVTAGPDGKAFAKLPGTSSVPAVGTGFTIDVSAGPTTAPGAVVACGDQNPTRWHHGHGHFDK